MTKTTTKAIATTKESAPLIVLGYDQNHKPRGGAISGKGCRPRHQGRPTHGPQGLSRG